MVNVYVRIAVPYNQSWSCNGDNSSIGHYDLIIDDLVSFVGHFGISTGDPGEQMQRPVISWESDSRLRIRPLSSAPVKTDCQYYKWHMQVAQTDIDNLLTNLSSVCGSDLSISNSLIKFRPSGSFHTYNIYDKNCFVAVSVWMSALGIVNLSDIVSGSLSRRMYTRVLYTQVGKFVGWPIVSL